MTGPKISSWTISSSWRSPEITVGEKENPRSPNAVPPVSIRAWSGSRSIRPWTRESCAALLSGPKSTPGVCAAAALVSSATKSSWIDVCTSTRLPAVQS